MLQLNIRTQPTVTQFAIQEPQINLRTTLPAVQLNTEAAKLEISSPEGELHIDQTPCRYSLGIKDYGALARDIAQAGRQTALAAIARIANEGDQLADISNEGGEALFSIARSRSQSKKVEVNLGWIDNPIIDYQPRQTEISASRPDLDLRLQRGTVTNDFLWGQVDYQIKQYPDVKIWTTGSMDTMDVQA
ncbi:MAG: DUF6470 family protein [Sporomusaceae bacterium]|nr:DUF6470 family protein [Sporomusaceae bacterium]